MQKGVFLIGILIVLAASSLVSGATLSVEQEIKRLAHYAQEYEIGNINYAQFSVYLASVQEHLNAALGASRGRHDSVLNATQLETALGPPSEKTRWIWVEKEDREIRLEKEVPAWRTVVFDGKKLQIRLNAWPHLRRANDGKVRYRLNTEIVFKQPENAIDSQAEISRILRIAETFQEAPTRDNAATLARESVLTERTFSELLTRSPSQCEATITSLLGTAAQRREQKTLRKEITLYEGKNYEGMLMLESCDECEWQWINMHSFVNTRGRTYPGESGGAIPDQNAREYYKNLTNEQFKEEIRQAINNMKTALQEHKSIREYDMKLRALNDAWNERSNDVHKEIEQRFRKQREALPGAALQNYNWKAEENERRALEVKLRKLSYEDRLRFYTELFAQYPVREQRFKEVNFERRLIETSRTVTSEMCSNQKDDDGDTAIDCADTQCGGNWCGNKKITITHQGIPYNVTRDLYCMQNACQLKSDAEILQQHELRQREEPNERTQCAQHPPIACTGTVLFKGKDAQGCPLPPVCITQKTSCSLDSDCTQPRCGTASCVEGMCKMIGLETCKESQCVPGEQRTKQCASGETLVTEFCNEGSWQSTAQVCKAPAQTPAQSPQPENLTRPSLPTIPKCAAIEECAQNEVCSASQCVLLPAVRTPPAEKSVIPTPPLERAPTPTSPPTSPPVSTPPASEPTPATPSPTTPSTTPVSLPPVPSTGRIIQENTSADNTTTPTPTPRVEPNTTVPDRQSGNETTARNESTFLPQPANESQYERNETQFMPRSERNESSPAPRSERNESRPFYKNETHYPSNETRPNGTRDQPSKIREEPHTYQEQVGVFQVGGSCRQSQDRQEGNIHFGGWGKPFESIEPLKQQYYQNGGEWCKREYENSLKQRQEFEASFNEKFAAWFFEEYMANGAEEWETHMSGIFDLYWRDVELSRQLAQSGSCLNLTSLPQHKLLKFNYETQYGKIEFWEEIKNSKINPNDEESVDVISPYMQVFLFPPKKFIMHELQQSMEAREFPGDAEERDEREQEEGLTDTEKARIREDEKFMKKLRKVTASYEGKLDASVRLVEPANNTVVFNLYVQINEQDIMKLQPMPPEAQPAQDVVVEIDFDRVYELADFIQHNMEGGRLESPPWDKKPRRVVDSAKEVYNGLKIWFKVQGLISSAKVTPAKDEDEIKSFVKSTLWKIMTQGDESKDRNHQEPESGGNDQKNSKVTGAVVIVR